MIAQHYIGLGWPVGKVLRFVGLAASSHHYRHRSGQRGNRPSTHTCTTGGQWVGNDVVVDQIRELLEQPWVDYGYIKVTWWLRLRKGYVINFKKVYRLMRQAKLLCGRRADAKATAKTWADWKREEQVAPLAYWQFDIKYIHIAGQRRNALLLTILDVKSRLVLGHLLAWSIRKQHVRDTFAKVFARWALPELITARSDNGTQFTAAMVREYLAEMQVAQEFTRPATPQQNGHVEAWHSIVDRSICRKVELHSLEHGQQVFDSFIGFYNDDRIHSGVGFNSPILYLLENGIDLTLLEYEQTQP